jgi:hypothetical protein
VADAQALRSFNGGDANKLLASPGPDSLALIATSFHPPRKEIIMNSILHAPSLFRSTFTASLVVVASTVTLLAATSEAQARERHSTTTGANGKTAQRDVSRSAGDVNATTTGPNGKAATRTVDRAPGSTEATVTGPNGKALTRSSQRSSAGNTQSTVTGPNGQSATRSSTTTTQP